MLSQQAKTFGDFGIEVRQAVGECDTTCPQCSGQRKNRKARCLSVNVDKGTWFCHHCGWSGGLGTGTRQLDPPWQKPTWRSPPPMVPAIGSAGFDWLASRGISREVAQRNGVCMASVYMPQVEEHVTAVCFPYYRGEIVVNRKYRDGKKNFRMEAGAERILYGLNDIEPARCVIVEGEMDKLALEMAGVRSCLSVPDGAPAESAKDYGSKFSFLESDADRINPVREWVIAVDSDGPGRRLEDELARRLGRERCRRVRWPEGCKDANDVLREHGAETLAQYIANAEPFPISGVFEANEFEDRIQHLFRNGWEKGVETGWEELDQVYTVRPGEFTVITGIPNSGKSNWLDALLVNLARLHGWHFAVFSPENQPVEDHMARIIEKWAVEPFSDGPTERMSQQTLSQGIEWASEHFSWILPDDDAEWTVDTVLEKAKALCFRRGTRGLVIDPWNELEHSVPAGESETLYISGALKRIRQFARRHGIHVWVVAHPAKLYREKDGGYPVPTLYDISGSANWRNKADNGICVWRDFGDKTAPVEIHVQKVRFRQVGKIGMAPLVYQPSTATYRDVSPHEHTKGRR